LRIGIILFHHRVMIQLLAIETSTELCSVAVEHPQGVTQDQAFGARGHSGHVLPMIAQIFAGSGVQLKECAAIAFGAGPGAFTGLRIACSIAQGLAYGAALPVIGVPTLAALAEAVRAACPLQIGTRVANVLDARMGEVYWSVDEWDGAVWHSLHPANLDAPDNAAQGIARFHAHWGAGNGFDLQHAGLKASVADISPVRWPEARYLLPLARQAWARGESMPPEMARPWYVRDQVALTSDQQIEARAVRASTRLADLA